MRIEKRCHRTHDCKVFGVKNGSNLCDCRVYSLRNLLSGINKHLTPVSLSHTHTERVGCVRNGIWRIFSRGKRRRGKREDRGKRQEGKGGY